LKIREGGEEAHVEGKGFVIQPAINPPEGLAKIAHHKKEKGDGMNGAVLEEGGVVPRTGKKGRARKRDT